ncbi:RNA polymerase sigma factor [Arachidicoccus sp.]|uniref:RNA polymerase sigma factor n=1 Tax=Arachidicoccus sp. TaxID=1872624 RepID=UPI003D207F02
MQFLKQTLHQESAGDHELIALYKKTADTQVLATLYERYMALVYGVCLKYLKEEEQCKDAVMQIFENLIDKLLAHEVSNFKSWLHVLTKNFCLMELRKSSRYVVTELDESFMQISQAMHHEDSWQKEADLSALEKCLETLSEEQNKTVRMFYLEEKCYKEVAEQTGFKIEKVRSYIQNGKRNLKICMEKNTGE